MLTAISVILMLISGSMDTGKLGTLVLLSFLPVILITEGMRTGAVALWGATLLCGWMLIPDKTLPLAYGLFFGPFAFLWMALGRLRQCWLRILLGLLAFNAVWIPGLFLVRTMWEAMPILWIYLAGQPVFVIYYYLYGYAVGYYHRFWAMKIRRWMGGQG